MDLVLAWQLRERPAAPCRVPSNRKQPGRALIEPFEVLYEAELPRYELPPDLAGIYGRLGFTEPVLYANFVSSLDGVVALGSAPSAGSVLSGRDQHDRFLMALLRACADAVLIGAGTLHATPGHQWTAEHVYPSMGRSFARLRESLGRRPRPRLVLFTASGRLDASHPAVVAGATVVTTHAGAAALEGRLPADCDVIPVGRDDVVDVNTALDELRSRGLRVLLTEGGPHVTGQLVSGDLLDEVFLTISPVLAGRNAEERLGMIAGVELLPARRVSSHLLSARHAGDFLYLRYGLR